MSVVLYVATTLISLIYIVFVLDYVVQNHKFELNLENWFVVSRGVRKWLDGSRFFRDLLEIRPPRATKVLRRSSTPSSPERIQPHHRHPPK